MTVQLKALLRVCASCEWIYKVGKNPGIFGHNWDCPKCSFISYGARHVYGNKCYKYTKSQQPCIDGKVHNYRIKLLDEINEGKKK